ncbi:Tim44/TimA family putative adaptor protein [Terrihabitans rhizophilus]|uniref:Tim44/TimA family putative adaptor protein n=1 Tax=Terrihabitans rhizophilus TaxID=3092662 RepID=A0ABU4RX87_9HYPH|nr:Tim44/TimA family putative adaptor protein [Terrihabitans sp. PJ23]MDX6807526.1 Tim44/TimA family putative adaptor protein [Terrihabitans sp. PJ23]
MSEVFDIYTVIFLVLAVFIILRLRSVLGTRTGNERPPERAARRDAPPETSANENVVRLPTAGSEIPPEPVVDPSKRWKGVVPEGSPVEAGLDEIKARDPSFDGLSFVEGARAAYEMIVTSFAKGDTRQLKMLLAKDVYESFAAAIADRERRGEVMDSNFVSVGKPEIQEAELAGNMAQIAVRFVSQLITATRDKSGAVIDGNAETVTEVVDHWTFARDVTSRDPNWKLVRTEAA